MSIPAPISACPITSAHLRLNASDHAPAGMSESAIVAATTVPSTRSCGAERWASITKYRSETST